MKTVLSLGYINEIYLWAQWRMMDFHLALFRGLISCVNVESLCFPVLRCEELVIYSMGSDSEDSMAPVFS